MEIFCSGISSYFTENPAQFLRERWMTDLVGSPGETYYKSASDCHVIL